MKKTLAGLLASAALIAAGSTGALADGMPKGPRAHAPAPAPMAAHGGCCCGASRFAGWYGGVQFGFATLTTDINNDFLPFTYSTTEDGYNFGGQIGRNWANCNFVFGIEADFSFSTLEADNSFLGGALNINTSMDWLGSIRTRTGLAMDNLFIYATGGIAFADTETRFSIGGVNVAQVGGVRFGWVAGVGTEYILNERARIVSDVLYYDFGTESETIGGIRLDDHQSLWVSRIGINFALGGHGHGHGHATHVPVK